MFSRKSLTVWLTREIIPNPILSNKIYDKTWMCKPMSSWLQRRVIYVFRCKLLESRVVFHTSFSAYQMPCCTGQRDVWLSTYGAPHIWLGYPKWETCLCVHVPWVSHSFCLPDKRDTHGKNGKPQVPPLTLHNQTCLSLVEKKESEIWQRSFPSVFSPFPFPTLGRFLMFKDIIYNEIVEAD